MNASSPSPPRWASPSHSRVAQTMGPAVRLSCIQLPHRDLQQSRTTSTRLRRQAQDPAAPERLAFKAPEIKRPVRAARRRREILLVNFENEDPLYRLDGIPFSPPPTGTR